MLLFTGWGKVTKNVLDRIFQSKKDKQRYLDYVYVFTDEHTTATNGRYELREGLEQELKNGTYKLQYDKFFPPVFETLGGIHLANCDSSKGSLIRAADIVANRIYYMALNRNIEKLAGIYLTTLP